MKIVARKKIKTKIKLLSTSSSFYRNATRRLSISGGIKRLAEFETKFARATKSKSLTYSKLEVFSLSQLKKMGYSTKSIYNKLNSYYRKEGRQLMLDKTDEKSFTRAIRDLKKGKLYSSRVIVKTERSREKLAYNKLKKIAEKTSSDSFANQVLDSYQKGYMNSYQLNTTMSKFTANAGAYLEPDDLDKVTYIIQDYNNELMM